MYASGLDYSTVDYGELSDGVVACWRVLQLPAEIVGLLSCDACVRPFYVLKCSRTETLVSTCGFSYFLLFSHNRFSFLFLCCRVFLVF